MSNDQEIALYGGDPVRNSFLPYGKQKLDQYDIDAVNRVLKNDFLTTGPTISAFESKLCEFVQSEYAVIFSSGTAALHAACYAANIRSDDEVITSAMTFAASSNCVLYNGGRPVFADIDPSTYNISPNSIESLINENTKAIIPVDFTGRPCDYDEILSIAKKYKLIIIEDAAHALGATYNGVPVGNISDMTIFSFHPVKHITTAEGGAVTTNNKAYYEKLIQFRTHGITRENTQLIHNHGPWYYEMHFLGYNYRMSDLHAALGISQIDKLNHFLELRQKYVDMYNRELACMKELTLPAKCSYGSSSWHLYVIRLNLEFLTAGRKTIFEALLAENIGVNVHYIPVYYHPYYQSLGYNKGLCPNAEELYEQIITLPLHPSMTEVDVKDVVKAVKKVISYFSREKEWESYA